MLLQLLLLLPIFCAVAEKSVLIIGGSISDGVVEQFYPSKMTSKKLVQHKEVAGEVRATPVNDTHAFVIRGTYISADKTIYNKSFYIDKKGKLSPGPKIRVVHYDLAPGLAITSLPGQNGQLRPIYCYYKPERKMTSCDELSTDGTRFVHHSDMTLGGVSTIIAFGKMMIALGDGLVSAAEKWNGRKWEAIKQPTDRYNISLRYTDTVKLNNSMLMACGALSGSGTKESKMCSIYNLDSDQWRVTHPMEGSIYTGEMVLVDDTVYAFGGNIHRRGNDYRNIQTLKWRKNLSPWTLDKHPLKAKHEVFGAWVIND